MKTSEAMRRLKMSVFRPGRRTRYTIRWVDPATGSKREQSSGKTSHREAYQVASDLAQRIVDGLPDEDPLTADVVELYERQVEDRRIGRAREPWISCKGWLQKLGCPRRMTEITAQWVAGWQTKLRKAGLSENTVGSHSARLRAFLRWADRQRLIDRAPWVSVRIEEAPRSRAIVAEEFDRLLAAVPKIRPRDPGQWARLLRGQWWSGFRIDELVNLSWDPGATIRIDTSGRFPVVTMAARANKKRKNRVRPILPEFWAICQETPPGDRRGRVFPIVGERGQMTTKSIGKVISRIGAEARVKTNAETGKLATSHDLRRAFAVRLDGRATLPELQRWLDHGSIKTTLTYYRTTEADELAEKLWPACAGGALGGAGDPADSNEDSSDETQL